MEKKKNIVKRCATSIYSRVTGFYSAIHLFNPGKQQEAKDRHKYDKDVKRAKTDN